MDFRAEFLQNTRGYTQQGWWPSRYFQRHLSPPLIPGSRCFFRTLAVVGSSRERSFDMHGRVVGVFLFSCPVLLQSARPCDIYHNRYIPGTWHIIPAGVCVSGTTLTVNESSVWSSLLVTLQMVLIFPVRVMRGTTCIVMDVDIGIE